MARRGSLDPFVSLCGLITVGQEANLTVFFDRQQIDLELCVCNRFYLILGRTILKYLLMIHIVSDHLAWIHATVNLRLSLELLSR